MNRHLQKHKFQKRQNKSFDNIKCSDCLNLFRTNGQMRGHKARMPPNHTFPFDRIEEVSEDGQIIARYGIIELEE